MNPKMFPTIMGVINLTPDSFSDGSQYNLLEPCQKRVRELISSGVQILDFGAESTAPMNKPISGEEELKRLKNVLVPLVKKAWPKENPYLSIDTYKTDVFREIYGELLQLNPELKLIWNDVSGVLEEDTVDLLTGPCSKAQYIFCHSQVPERSESSHHMSYLKSEVSRVEDIVYKKFEDAQIFFGAPLMERVWFDPCFGFSKTFEQNWRLLKQLPKLISRFSKKQKWLLGVSRKSFFQKCFPSSEIPMGDPFIGAECLHSQFLSYWMQELYGFDWAVRLHDPRVVKAIEVFQSRILPTEIPSELNS